MITVQLNEDKFAYEIDSLVRAFYPGEEVLVRTLSEDELPEADIRLCIEYRECGGSIYIEIHEGDDIALDKRKDRYSGDACTTLCNEARADFSDRGKTRDILKQTLYKLLSEKTGKTLPWGTLTGVRPSKVTMSMLEKGFADDEIREKMRDYYFVSAGKTDLSLEVAKREICMLDRTDREKGFSLYINIPFCLSTCLYCSFTSYPLEKWAERVDEYLDALEKEIKFVSRAYRDRPLNAVYIGGGTPTTLSPDQLRRLILCIGESFALTDGDGKIVYADGKSRNKTKSGSGSRLLEFTVEAGRPDSITAEKLEVLKEHGILRISINPQSMKDETLRLIGRRHTTAELKESYHLAREMGFDNINMDIILGLPEETIDDLRRTLNIIEEMAPESLTVHSLAVKRAARLKMQEETYRHLRMQNTDETITLSMERCRRMGMRPYYLYRQKNMAGNFENVGYAKAGFEDYYNVLIMEEKQTIMALGAGGVSKFVYAGGERIERTENVKELALYLERIDEMIERKKRKIEEIREKESRTIR